MLRKYQTFLAVCLLLLAPASVLAAQQSQALPAHRLFRVTLDGASDKPVSGRLLLFATRTEKARAAADGGKVDKVDTSPFRPTETAVAAMEVTHLAPGASVWMDADELAFPAGFSTLDPGLYSMQVVLDVNHDYNYGGRGDGDLVSEVTEVRFGDDPAVASLTLTRTLDERPEPWSLPARASAEMREKMQPALDAGHKHSRALDFVSPALTEFRGAPVHMKGWVLLPPDYDKHAGRRYPTVYFTHGFGGTLSYLTFQAASMYAQMEKGEIPPMIWVFLDESGPTGTHEFADSVNNGPWGRALTTELIPYLESRYRMDGTADGRFLTGHSSGGWATLWLQTRYPKVFGGTWSTAPDSSDFRDFTGADLYAPDANVYHRADGSAIPLVRADGKVVATFKQFAQLERVLGPYGGQMASFEWVFSPRGADGGRPVPMFDRDTGKVDPKVAAYWREHYDIAHRIKTHWPELKADLDGKIHLIVGTADTFYLDGAAHKLKQVLDQVGADAEVEFLPGKTHGNLFEKDGNRHWLMQQIAWAMYHHARPDADIPAAYRHEIDR